MTSSDTYSLFDNGDEKPFPISRKARTRGKGCLYEANDFTMRKCGVYDITGNNMAQSVYINGNGNTIVLAGNQQTPSTLLVEQGSRAQGLSDDWSFPAFTDLVMKHGAAIIESQYLISRIMVPRYP